MHLKVSHRLNIKAGFYSILFVMNKVFCLLFKFILLSKSSVVPIVIKLSLVFTKTFKTCLDLLATLITIFDVVEVEFICCDMLKIFDCIHLKQILASHRFIVLSNSFFCHIKRELLKEVVEDQNTAHVQN